MKTLILHIGTYKTGTTSIQNSLYLQRDKLLDLGINYISIPGEVQEYNGRQTIFRNEVDFIVKSLAESPGDVHILSNEGLWDRKELKDRFLKVIIDSKIYSTVKVVAYIRRQDEFLDSFFKQENKVGANGVAGLPIVNFIEEITKIGTLDYLNILNNYGELFGFENIKVRLFEKEHLLNSDVVSDFLNLLDVDYNNFETHRLNETISTQYGYFAHRLNKVVLESFNENDINIDDIDGDKRNKIRKLVRDNVELILRDLPLKEVEFNLITDNVKKRLLQKFHKDNIQLVNKYNLPQQSKFINIT